MINLRPSSRGFSSFVRDVSKRYTRAYPFFVFFWLFSLSSKCVLFLFCSFLAFLVLLGIYGDPLLCIAFVFSLFSSIFVLCACSIFAHDIYTIRQQFLVVINWPIIIKAVGGRFSTEFNMPRLWRGNEEDKLVVPSLICLNTAVIFLKLVLQYKR